MFSREIEAIVFFILQTFCNAREKIFMNSLLNWIKFDVMTFRGGRKVCKLGNNIFAVYLIVDGFHFLGFFFKTGALFLATHSSTALAKT